PICLAISTMGKEESLLKIRRIFRLISSKILSSPFYPLAASKIVKLVSHNIKTTSFTIDLFLYLPWLGMNVKVI
ncbi:MAG: hypothetical protein WBY22_13115, partial [Nitrososphaeraceae archaeon]